MALQISINKNSLDLVFDELSNTLQQATNVFETFLSERHNAGLLQQCEADLRQIGGTLRLLEIPGAALLADEMRNLCAAVQDNDEDDSEAKLNALSTALFVLPRYLEFINSRGSDIPLLSLTHVNEMRASHGQLLLPDSYFETDDGWLFSRDSKVSLRNKALTGDAFDNAVKPIRKLYQNGLLGLLRDSHAPMQLTLMSRALRRLCSFVPAGEVQRFWLLASAVVEAFANDGLEVNPRRKRQLTALDGALRNTKSDGTRLNPILERELIYLLGISGYREGLAGKLLGINGFRRDDLNDHDLQRLRQDMLGVTYDTVSTAIGELRNELRHAKDVLELIAQHGRSDQEELGPLADLLQQNADVMQVLNLSALGNIIDEHASELRRLIGTDLGQQRNALESLAESLLFVESSLAQIDRRKLNYDQLDNLTLEKRDAINSENLVEEARSLVIIEAKAAVGLVKRALASYIESGFDFTHIANLPSAINGIRGAFQMLNLGYAASITDCAKRFMDEYVRKHSVVAESGTRSLEMLADAMISIEYYLGDMERHFVGDEKILRIADDSLTALGFPPATEEPVQQVSV